MTSRARIAALTHADAELLIPHRGEPRPLAVLHAERATLTPEEYSAVRLFLGGGKRGRARARELVPLACPGCACRLTHFERSGKPAYFAPTVATSVHGAHCDEGTVASQAPAPLTAELPPSALTPGVEVPLLYSIDAQPTDERACPIADAGALLVQALNRAVPAGSQVQVGGRTYAIVAAADLHLRSDGDAVAVYGRLSEAEWNEQSGRLTLRATPRTVQIWATAGVPRALLGFALGEAVEAPLIRKPVPFLVFGTLRKLAGVCGIPVIRSTSIELLQPLTFSLRVLSAEAGEAAAALADELDELLSSLPPLGSEAADAQLDA